MVITRNYVTILCILSFISCSTIDKGKVSSGNISGNARYRNYVVDLDVMSQIIKPEKDTSKSRAGRVFTHMISNGDIIGAYIKKNHLIVYRVLYPNYSQVDTFTIINLEDSQSWHDYKLDRKVTYNYIEESVIELDKHLVISLRDKLISIPFDLRHINLRSASSIEEELEQFCKCETELGLLKKVSTDNSFILDNNILQERDTNLLSVPEKIQILVELDARLKITRKQILPYLDLGRWYQEKDLKRHVGQWRLLEFNHFDSIYKSRNLDFKKYRKHNEFLLINSEYDSIYYTYRTKYRTRLDEFFKIGHEYYFINPGFISSNDSIKELGHGQYLITYSQELDTIVYDRTAKRYTDYYYDNVNDVKAQAVKDFYLDSISFVGTDKKVVQYFDNEKHIGKEVKPIIIKLLPVDTLKYDYLNCTSRFPLEFGSPPKGHRVRNSNPKQFITRTNVLSRKIVQSGKRRNNKNENWYLQNNYNPNLRQRTNILHDENFNIIDTVLGSFNENYLVAKIPNGFIFADNGSNWDNDVKMQAYNNSNKNLVKFSLISDRFRNEETKILSDMRTILPFKNGFQYITCKTRLDHLTKEDWLTFSIISFDSLYEVNRNDFEIKLETTGKNQLDVKILSNGLPHRVSARLLAKVNMDKVKSYKLNKSSFSIAPPRSIFFGKIKYSEKDLKSWPRNFHYFIPDSLYRFTLEPGTYYLVTDPIYPETKNESNLHYGTVNVVSDKPWDKFGRKVYGNRRGTFDDIIFIRHQFKIVVKNNGKIKVIKLKYK